ncbi:PLP-dependent aminotransferase family protein [Paenibacillus allorhizosphaerae]|uniref:HTH-type transcriptional regulatory protein GabR n=1 Tax=Paenibacillus allorhizosphaerae TaxID=2849866 RepID=A0ABN7TKD3_9BACL|nr:PLP-dependent aminotransferase family protein [Paenibacillus allorhizosphaerae]CAG7643355.1 HTH-type transcriptional regulatory protein GabR [Paenibacillus allorhizosphaerae]
MLNLNLTDRSAQPSYMQLYTQIRDQIRSGGIPYGSRLPSVRSLMQQLSISKTTVESAYQILLAEGYAVSRPRSGLYVTNPFGVAKPAKSTAELLPTPKQPLQLQVFPADDCYRIDFRPSAVDEQLFPMRSWRKVLHEALDHSQGKINKYGDPQGEYAFRSVLAEYLRNSRGVVCVPEQIVVGTGIHYSVGILAKLFAAGIDHIAFEEPGFAPVREHFIQYGFQVSPIEVRDNGISLEGLENSGAQAVYITPSHQFPTGSVMPYPERERLLHWAQTRDAYIIEDDYDGEFRYFVKPLPSLQGLDRDGRVIYIGTFSKAFTPALRMNYLVLPLILIEKMRQVQYLFDGPSRIDQWAMQSFIEQGHWYRHIRRMRKTYGKKHHRFIELIRTHLGERVQITGHNAGLHVQLTVNTRQTSDVLVKLAAEEGVKIYDLQEMRMRPRPPGDPQIYLGFGGVHEKEMEEGIRLIKKSWEGLWNKEKERN